MAPVQHFVALRFKDSATQEQIDAFFSEAAAMTKAIPGISAFTHGPNTSSEGLSRGLTHAFLMVFESPAARDAYLPHPVHEAFKEKHLPHVAEVFVVDI